MSAEIRLTNRFVKSFEKLESAVRERIEKAVFGLAENPRGGKRLKGDLEGQWSLRVGHHRVLYTIEGSVVWVETVSHRREAYRRRR